MSDETIYVRSSRAEVRRVFEQIPQAAMGRYGARKPADALMTRCGLALKGRIYKAFIVKSRGGTDDAGEKWKSLSPYTIAYRRRHKGLPGANKRAGKRPSSALTNKQRDRWWSLYQEGLRLANGNKVKAARRAWFLLKKEGGVKTIMGRYGHLEVDILRDTGILLNSLSPGVVSSKAVFRIGRGEVVVGTNRKWAGVHHRGGGRVPQRRLWPEPHKWPATWWQDITEQALAGLVGLTKFLLGA